MKNSEFERLISIMKTLRVECPWDKEQTHKSIKRNFLEETYEAIEAIENEDVELLKEELGDVLLQVVFHAQIEAEIGNFDIYDVCRRVSDKLVLRHPHIFSDTKVADADEVLSNWNKIKKVEKNQNSTYDVLNSVSKALPSLIRGEKIYSKALSEKVDIKVESYVNDLDKSENLEEDLPKTLFEIVKIAKDNKIDLEDCFNKYLDSYIKNFK